MANSIVLELQEQAAGSAVPLQELLRKALLIATKLGLPDFQRWVRNELDGYRDGRFQDLPVYRQAYGELRVTVHGREISATFDLSAAPTHVVQTLNELLDVARQFPLVQPVSELEALCTGTGTVKVRKHDFEQLLRETGENVQGPINLHTSKAKLRTALNGVRQALLQWTLDLEGQGITGSGATFSESEKEAAKLIHHNVTNNFGAGSIAQFSQGDNNVQNVHTTSGIPMEDLQKLVTSLEAERAKNSTAQFEQALVELQATINAPKPEKVRIKNALVMLKDVATLAQIGMNMLPKVYEMIGMLT